MLKATVTKMAFKNQPYCLHVLRFSHYPHYRHHDHNYQTYHQRLRQHQPHHQCNIVNQKIVTVAIIAMQHRVKVTAVELVVMLPVIILSRSSVVPLTKRQRKETAMVVINLLSKASLARFYYIFSVSNVSLS